MRSILKPLATTLPLVVGLAGPGWGQELVETTPVLPGASHVVVPQAHGWSLHHDRQGIQIEGVEVRAEIRGRTATTTMEVRLFNHDGRQAEAVLLLPVPEQAAVSQFLFEGSAAEPTAKLMRREEARRIYEQIVARVRDPALLEFAGFNLIRSSVFPVPAGGRQRIRVTYEHVLPVDGNRIDYVLPRSESLQARTPWKIQLDVSAREAISTVYSPSHELLPERLAPNKLNIRMASASAREPGPFRLSYLLERHGVSASLVAYPDPKVGGGYFLLMAGLPASLSDHPDRMKREVTLVIDRSGSMAGEKMDQVRAAALQVIEGLEDGEAFNIIDYSTTVSGFAPAPVIKSQQTLMKARAYLGSLRPMGGTNIHDALLEALRQAPSAGKLPLVLFLTDGLPTVGRTSEVAIRDLVQKGNPHERRVFTFGVGADVNVPLLDRVAEISRATTTYVLPKEDVELKVAQVFRRLYGPVLAGSKLEVLDQAGGIDTRSVRELIPNELPDLFEGDQLVLLGQYRGSGPLHFRLSGQFLNQERNFRFQFKLDKASVRNGFVPRLWASRRIAYLADQIRQAGAVAVGQPFDLNATLQTNPQLQELIDEILRLSTEFGVLSEYTAFLATEGTDFGDWGALALHCTNNLETRAWRARSGVDALNQGMNFQFQKAQKFANPTNRYWNAQLEEVEITGVQQLCDRAFFKRGNQWVDSRLVTTETEQQPDEVVEFGSKEHFELLGQLLAQGREGVLSLKGEILIQFEDRKILVKDANQTR